MVWDDVSPYLTFHSDGPYREDILTPYKNLTSGVVHLKLVLGVDFHFKYEVWELIKRAGWRALDEVIPRNLPRLETLTVSLSGDMIEVDEDPQDVNMTRYVVEEMPKAARRGLLQLDGFDD